jgi:hypothetical protein
VFAFEQMIVDLFFVRLVLSQLHWLLCSMRRVLM